MRIITPEFNLIKIGYQGENEAVCVQIGVQNWPELYGAGGTFSLRHQRAGDPDGYPVIVTEEDGTVSWVVSNIDTRDPGYGKATLIYKVNDVVAMSVEYSTLTEASVGENPEPPEPWKPWIDEILEARDDAVEAAEDAAEDARSASDSANDASADALKAEGYAVGTQDGEAVGPDSPYYENNAKYYYEEITDELGPIQSHLVDYNNPHQVTKAQVGLGNADNTSDLDKPISTATQAALDGKISKVAGAVADNIAVLTADGSVADSGISADYLVPVKAKSGSVIEFNSDGAVPLKSATLKGKTAAVNQLANPTNGATTDLSFTVSDGVLTINGTTVNANYKTISASGYKTIIGHKYYVGADHTLSADEGLYVYNDGGGIVCGYNSKEIIGTATAEKPFYIVFASGKTFSNTTLRVMIIDLTLCGFTSSETADVATLKAAWLNKYGVPLPQYIPYNAGSIVSNNATYQLCGHNIWDEEWEEGSISTASGTNDTGSNLIRSKNYIRVTGGATYYYRNATVAAGVVYFYTEANSAGYIGYEVLNANGTFTPPSNCTYMRFRTGSNYGATYNHDIAINFPATVTTYEKHHDGGTIVADSLNGIGTVADEQDASGNIIRRFAAVDMGSLSWTYAANRGGYMWVELPLKKKNTPMVCARYKYIGVRPDPTYDEDKVIALESQATDYIDVHDTAYTDAAAFKTAMSGVYLVYELATPTTDTTTPASLITQKGYNILRTVSGDVQNAPADIEYFNGLAAVIAEALQ